MQGTVRGCPGSRPAGGLANGTRCWEERQTDRRRWRKPRRGALERGGRGEAEMRGETEDAQRGTGQEGGSQACGGDMGGGGQRRGVPCALRGEEPGPTPGRLLSPRSCPRARSSSQEGRWAWSHGPRSWPGLRAGVALSQRWSVAAGEEGPRGAGCSRGGEGEACPAAASREDPWWARCRPGLVGTGSSWRLASPSSTGLGRGGHAGTLESGWKDRQTLCCSWRAPRHPSGPVQWPLLAPASPDALW